MMAHAQKPDSVFQRKGRVHLYRRGCQFSRVLAFLECGSGENDCSNTGWTVPSQTEDCLASHSIRLFPLHFSSRASPCATRFRFHSTYHTLSELGLSSTTTAHAHTSAAISRLNWRPRRFKMESPVSPKDEIWFLRVCHHTSNAVYYGFFLI